jgi:CheY-like chemotaxis protein
MAFKQSRKWVPHDQYAQLHVPVHRSFRQVGAADERGRLSGWGLEFGPRSADTTRRGRRMKQLLGTADKRPNAGAGPGRVVVPPWRVVLIDDAVAERELLGIWLDESLWFTVVGQASDGPSGTALTVKLRPDLVVLDLSMPGGDGVKSLANIVSASPLSRVMVFSGFLETNLAGSLRRLGAAACLDKSAGLARLVEELLRIVDVPQPV